MKRHDNLFDRITSYENLVLAHQQAKKGKSHYREVKWVNNNQKQLLLKLQKSLKEKTFTTSKYQVEEIFDGRKNRTIYKLPYYPDRIVQHALTNVCEDFWIKSYIRDTFQSIPNRGTNDARKRVKQAIKNQHGQYALKFDIEKYYPSVDNSILKQIIRKKIKCDDTLWLIDNIIDSSKGIPIGNYTSQHFGNLYLNEFDWWVKQTLKVKKYYRYCDDIVVIGNSSNYCHTIKHQMFKKLNEEYNLTVKNNWQVFSIDDRGLDFVGYVFKPTQTTLRNSIARNFKNKSKTIKLKHNKMSRPQIVSGYMSYWGWIKHCNAKSLWKKETDQKIIKIFNDLNLKRNTLARTAI
jgi:RNA-directed DNA polymerase